MSIIFPEGITFELRYLSIYDTNPEEIPIDLKFALAKQSRTVYDGDIDTSNVIDVSYLYDDCNSLARVPMMNFSKVKAMEYTFNYCYRLESIPQFDTSNVTTFRNCFYQCSSLVTIPELNTSKATKVDGMFGGCYSLRSVPLLDFGNVDNIYDLFGWNDIETLTDLGGFKNLKISCTGNLNLLPNLTVQSLMNVINNLYDFRANGDSTTTETLQLGTTNLNKLTDEQKAVATNKGWSLT